MQVCCHPSQNHLFSLLWRFSIIVSMVTFVSSQPANMTHFTRVTSWDVIVDGPTQDGKISMQLPMLTSGMHNYFV